MVHDLYRKCKALFIYGIKSTRILLSSSIEDVPPDGWGVALNALLHKMKKWFPGRSHGLNLLATKCNCHLLPSSSNNGIESSFLDIGFDHPLDDMTSSHFIAAYCQSIVASFPAIFARMAEYPPVK